MDIHETPKPRKSSTVFFPLCAVCSAYDGTLPALLIATALMSLEWWRQSMLQRRG